MTRRARSGRDPAISDPRQDPGLDEAARTDAATRTGEPAVTPVDPLAIRVAVAATSRVEGDPIVTVSLAPLPVLRRQEHLAGTAILGGVPSPAADHAGDGRRPGRAAGADPVATDRPDADGASATPPQPGPDRSLIVDGRAVAADLEWLDAEHVVLAEAVDGGPRGSRILVGPRRRRDSDGLILREIVIDGWRVEVELEPERRASLRERARRGSDVAGRGGPVEVRAIIPGRIVALSVGPGDPVSAGQQLLVLEAMKMQNELRAPREGTIERIPIAVGENVEVGDLLLVIT